MLSHAKLVPQLAIEIRDVEESVPSSAAGEIDDRINFEGQRRHSDEVDLISKFLFDSHDRGGFGPSKRSPGCPHPEHHVRVVELGEVDSIAVEIGEVAD